MKNPFIYGGVVTGENFADRERELKEIKRDLEDGEKIFLISPRRYGKTSLIINALSKAKAEGFFTVYIDLYKVTSIQKLLEIFTREIASAIESKHEKIFDFLKKMLPGLRPKITIQPDGSASIGIEQVPSEKETVKFLEEVFELPQKIAVKKNNNFVIVFDEFQEIRNLNGETLEKSMRACFQNHDRVGYLFAGSKKHILYDMVTNPEKAFYKMGKIVNLDKIPREIFREFLEKKFEKTNFRIQENVIDSVLDLVENYPYNAQFFCHKLWDNFNDVKQIKITHIEPTMQLILSEYTPFYLTLWDGLSLHQRRLLQAIADLGSKNLFSQEFIHTGNLGTSSSIQTSLRLLLKKQILDKNGNDHFFTDIFFREWIKWKI